MIVGFIGFGTVNYRINSLLKKNNIKTLSSYENRSNLTKSRLKNSNIEILNSFEDVVESSDILIDATSPKQALNNYKKYSKILNGLYLDLNNISKKTIDTMNTNDNFIDGAIIGKIDSKKPLIIASGKNASKLDFLNQYELDFKVISDKKGDASLLKTLRSSYTKSLSAILIESLDFASNLNLEDEFFNILSVTEGKDFREKSESRIKNTKKNKMRKIEEIDEILNYFKDDDTTMLKATKEKFKKI